MSVSLKAEQERAGLQGNGLGSIRWKKHRNQNNPTRLTDLPKYLMGFQKMNTVTQPGGNWALRYQNAVNKEVASQATVVTDWGGDNYGPDKNRTDPFNEMLSSRMKGYSGSWVGMYANMYGVRRNANASESIRLKLERSSISYGTVNNYSTHSSVVVVTYKSWSDGTSEVVHSYQPYTYWDSFDEVITLPANGHAIVLVSVQHTIPQQVGDQTYGMGIFDWSCEYV